MKKIGLLVLALVMALGALGVGYAAWTSSVSVNATVATGNVLIGIKDNGSAPAATGTGASVGSGYFDGLTFAALNSYPGRAISYNVEVKNLGTLNVTPLVSGSFTPNAEIIFEGATISVGVNGGGMSAPVAFTSVSQINPYLPSALAAGAALDLHVIVTLDPALAKSAETTSTLITLTVTGTQLT